MAGRQAEDKITAWNSCEAEPFQSGSRVVEVSEGGQNQRYHVPYGMLSKEEQAKASQAKAKPKARVRQPKVKAKLAAKKDLRMEEQSDEDSADNDEESSDNDEKAYRRDWDQVFSAFAPLGVHPSFVADAFDHKDLIFMGRKDY